MCDKAAYQQPKIFVCYECNNDKACSRFERECKPLFCVEHTAQVPIRCEWREYLPGDDIKSS